MQFSLLNFLIGLPQLNALANGAPNSSNDQTQKPENNLFSELLAEPSTPQSDLQNSHHQNSGELTQELVSNITVAQEAGEQLHTDDDLYLANLQGTLNRKISPQRAGDLLEQFDSNTHGERPPEILKEILETVESGSEPVSVQDILSQVASSQPEEAPEQRSNTLQRALQWLQNTLTPTAAPMEALAFANAASMFPKTTTDPVAPAERGQEKERTKEVAILMPQWVQKIGETNTPEKSAAETDQTTVVFTPTAEQTALPEVDLPTAPIAEEDSNALVATKHNQLVHANIHKPDTFDALIAELPTDKEAVADVSVAEIDTTTDTAVATQTTHTPHSNDIKNSETVRIHHANFAYARSEVMDQVKVGVTQAVRDGVDRITIQLNPTDLGRVEVKLDIVADGMSQVSFLVDKQETFDLLQRDARTLERMLQDAGVRADSGSMQFNLRQESQSKEPWGEARDPSDNDENEISTHSTGELPTQMYVHLVSDRLDITA